MSLEVTSVTRLNPAPCRHYRIAYDREGVAKTFDVDVDADGDLAELSAVEQLVLLWVRYRRAQSRSVIGTVA